MKFVDEKIDQYCIAHSTAPDIVCNEIETYTKANFSNSQMLIGKLEASLLGILLQSINAKNVLEIGTYTGYSALAIAGFLPKDGKITTLDRNEETTALAKTFWEKSINGAKIQPHVGFALDIIKKMDEKFDFVFIDADKENYPNYLELITPKLSKNAIIVIDNCLWSGSVLDETDNRPSTTGIRAVNKFAISNKNFFASLLPVRDGMLILRQKAIE